MKSNFWGYQALTAIAVVTVCGVLLAGCYKKSDVDIYPQPDPKYYIAGTVTDFTTGNPITTASVTIGGEAVNVNSQGSFSKEVSYTANAIRVIISADGYISSEQDVRLTQVGNGEQFLVELATALLKMGEYVPGGEGEVAMEATDWDKVKAALPSSMALTEATKTAIQDATGSSAGTVTPGTLTVGTITAPYVPVELPFTYEGQPSSVTAGFVNYNGFILLNDDLTETRAVDREIMDKFISGVVAKLGKPLGLTQAVGTFNIPAWANYSVTGYKATYSFTAKKYEFDIEGKTYQGIVFYQDHVIVRPTYVNHSTNDSHDGHGQNPNAGGGSGGF